MSLAKLIKYSEMVNIAEDLDEETLRKIGHRVLTGYNDDFSSSSEWMNDVKRVMDLANLKSKKKSYPLPTSANIKLPIITKASYEFASRTYPEIIKDGKLVKAKIIGKDDEQGTKKAQADRVTDYMNYQLLFQDTNWEVELDRLLNILPLIGFLCKKTYYDPIHKKIKSVICEYNDLIINEDVRNLDEAQRVSHILHHNLSHFVSASRSGVFLKEPVDKLISNHANDQLSPLIDVIEQHCFLDLDDDNLEEPYIVTVLKDSGEVLRIAPRFVQEGISENRGEIYCIEAIQFFTDYHFLVSPKGKFQSVGFGSLMLYLNETINTIMNQLVDAGQLSNLKGGFIDASFKMVNSGNTQHDPGEFKKIAASHGRSLKEGIVPIQYSEPSHVLQSLLGVLIQSSKELSSSTEVTSGNGSTENAKSGAVQAMIQQSLTVFNAIQRRIYRSLTHEYQKIFRLNGLYSDPSMFIQIINSNLQITQEDFDPKAVHILPVADPNLSSDIARMQQAQFLSSLQDKRAPGLNPVAVTQRILESTNMPNIQSLMMSEEQMNKPDPDTIRLEAELHIKSDELKLKAEAQALEEKKHILEIIKTESIIVLNRARAMQSVALADQTQSTTSYHEFDRQLGTLQTHLDALLGVNKLSFSLNPDSQPQEQQPPPPGAMNEQQNPGMVPPPSDQGIDQGIGAPA